MYRISWWGGAAWIEVSFDNAIPCERWQALAEHFDPLGYACHSPIPKWRALKEAVRLAQYLGLKRHKESSR